MPVAASRVLLVIKEYFDRVAEYAFSAANKGWRPEIQESPNGDGVWDTNKRWAHLAPKYFDASTPFLARSLHQQYSEAATRACRLLELPEEFYPGPDCTIRVLNYPAGATTAPHLDFDLFTLSMYRDVDAFRYLDDSDQDPELLRAREQFPGIHFGELLSEISPRFKATKHEVVATDEVQNSCVFFVLPSWAAKLPSGLTVGEWVEERKARSRR